MIEYFQKNHRLIIIVPMLSVVIFSMIFDLTMSQFSLGELFQNNNDPQISSMKSTFLLVCLSCAIIVCTTLASLIVAVHNFRLVWERRSEVLFFIWVGAILSIVFVCYNFVGYITETTNFVRLTYGLFSEYGILVLAGSWSVSSGTFFTIYAISIISIIVAAMFLAVSSVALALRNYEVMEEESAIRSIRQKLEAFRVSFYLSATLISSAILAIFSWQHMLRVSMSDTEKIIDFSQFMFSFSMYWGVSYSLIIILVFGPVGIICNRQIDDFVAFSAPRNAISYSEYLSNKAILPLRLTESTTITAAFAPLLTGVASNTVSLGLWGLT